MNFLSRRCPTSLLSGTVSASPLSRAYVTEEKVHLSPGEVARQAAESLGQRLGEIWVLCYHYWGDIQKRGDLIL